MLVSGSHVGGRYAVEEAIAKGGMALVYRVRHLELGSVHALKVLAIAGPDVKERLLQEGRVQARLRHPNIVAVTDVVDVGGLPGLVMELVDGPDLHAWRADADPTVEQVLDLFRGIVSAVAAAHERGLVHRDLKPGNVLVDRTREGLVPMVTDFGLARARERPVEAGILTGEGVPIGTPSFMAPEQIHDARNADERADIWALGGILYFLLAGRPAFQGRTVYEIMTRVSGGTYDRIELVRRDLPAPVREVIQRCLRVAPGERFQHAEDILTFLALNPVPALPSSISSLGGLVPPPRRRRFAAMLALSAGGAAGLTAIAATAVVVAVVGGVAWFRSAEPRPPAVAPPPVIEAPPPPLEEAAPPPPALGPSGCPLDAGRIGYVEGEGLGRKKVGDTWILPESRRVRADFDEGAATVCRLPGGTSIFLRAAPVKVRGGGNWVPVDGDAVRVPGAQ
jgi:serine/threonine-protein kinase